MHSLDCHRHRGHLLPEAIAGFCAQQVCLPDVNLSGLRDVGCGNICNSDLTDSRSTRKVSETAAANTHHGPAKISTSFGLCILDELGLTTKEALLCQVLQPCSPLACSLEPVFCRCRRTSASCDSVFSSCFYLSFTPSVLHCLTHPAWEPWTQESQEPKQPHKCFGINASQPAKEMRPNTTRPAMFTAM